MRPEILDVTRRTLRDDLHQRIQAVDVAPEIGALIEADVHALLDDMLVAFESAQLGRIEYGVVGAFTFDRAWSVILRHCLPWIAVRHGASARTAERLALSREGADA